MAARRSTFMEKQMEVEGKDKPHQYKQENRGESALPMDRNLDIKIENGSYILKTAYICLICH
jgi:hypothetical protein